ncbi:TraR/DksA family transcriptional regulator [Thermodesulfobacteriota bacterium]
MNKRDLKRFRRILEEKRARIETEAQGKLANGPEEEVSDSPSGMDSANTAREQSIRHRLYDRDFRLLRKIENSLDRIESGDFGTCVECGDPISMKRLNARPVATLCIACKEKQESMESRYADKRGQVRVPLIRGWA